MIVHFVFGRLRFPRHEMDVNIRGFRDIFRSVHEASNPVRLTIVPSIETETDASPTCRFKTTPGVGPLTNLHLHEIVFCLLFMAGAD
jgi:hypothetical protein